jgi:hypothetical protein
LLLVVALGLLRDRRPRRRLHLKPSAVKQAIGTDGRRSGVRRDQINEAYAELETGQIARNVIAF